MNPSHLSQQSYCHTVSSENYFWSPKMPSKDHKHALKTNSSFYKPTSPLFDEKARTVLGECPMNSTVLSSVVKMKQMKLMKPKELNIAGHAQMKDNSNIGSHHNRETNSGYSRNKLGGFFTS